MRIAIIGANGDVGRMILPTLAAHHDVRTIDINPSVHPEIEHVVASVLDFDDLLAAFDGQDVVVCLAMGAKLEWGSPSWARSNLEINVVGLHLVASAATAAGAMSVVSASSMSVFRDWFAVGQDEDATPDAIDAYGLSKRLGEEVLTAAASGDLPTAISLRLFGPVTDAEWDDLDPGDPDFPMFTSGSDVASAFLAAVEVRAPGHHILTVTGDADEHVLAWSRTRALIGWRPRRRRADRAPGTIDADSPS